MARDVTDSITTIDGHYFYAGRAAAYLIQDGDEAAFVDNVTRFSVPHLLEALSARDLRPEQVRYIIVTHVHLDHCGGTAELAKHCPKATVICHPRAARHIIDPTRLVASARPIYGDAEFDALYGEIEPVDAARVRSLEDAETLSLGSRTLTFFDSPGHARHHFVIQDSGTNSMLSGDAFGVCYAQLQGGDRPYLNYVCAPPQFDPAAARESIVKILESGVDRAFVTHFGCCETMEAGAEKLLTCVDRCEALVDSAVSRGLEGDALLDYCRAGVLDLILGEVRKCGLDPDTADVMKWATTEHSITSQGLAVLADQRRKAVQDASSPNSSAG